MIEIPFIYADDCLDCNRMRMMLQRAIKELGKECTIKEINSETSEAIDVAIKLGIEDIPGCKIGEKVLYGKRGFTYEKILNAFQSLL